MSITDSIVVCRDYAEMSRKAAEVFADYIKKNPHGILGLATGSSPEGLYDCLVEKYEKGELDLESKSDKKAKIADKNKKGAK